jgi:phosphoglycerate dehydrogenase-like enzyme
MMTKPEEEEVQEIFEIIDESAELIFYSDLDDDEKEISLSQADIILGFSLSKEQLEKAQNLKFQQTFATGVDRHQLEIFKERGIIFCNNHGHAFIIAEFGFALLNAASKELIQNDKQMRNGEWNPRKYSSVTLHNKNLLFLGYGEIAKSFKKLVKPLNMKLMAVKRTKKTDDSNVEIFAPEEKLKAINQADFIFNSLPKTQETENFLDKEEFEAMKPDAIVINVGRGGTINEKALYNALKEKKIKGAAIDTWYNYPDSRFGDKQEPKPCFPSKFPFQDLDNIIMSPHRAWATDLNLFEITKELLLNINRFIRGEPLVNVVNLDEGY